MIDYNNLWRNLISKLKAKGEIEFGLTIPYIIGAYNYYGYKFKDGEEISQLLNFIKNGDDPDCAVIQRCPGIHKHVIGLDVASFWMKNMKSTRFIEKNTGDKELKIVVTLNAEGLGSNRDDIVNSLKKLYQEAICDSKYSWSNSEKIWKEFSNETISTIEAALGPR